MEDETTDTPINEPDEDTREGRDMAATMSKLKEIYSNVGDMLSQINYALSSADDLKEVLDRDFDSLIGLDDPTDQITDYLKGAYAEGIEIQEAIGKYLLVHSK